MSRIGALKKAFCQKAYQCQPNLRRFGFSFRSRPDRSDTTCQCFKIFKFLNSETYPAHSTVLRKNWNRNAQSECSLPTSLELVVIVLLDCSIQAMCMRRNTKLNTGHVQPRMCEAKSLLHALMLCLRQPQVTHTTILVVVARSLHRFSHCSIARVHWRTHRISFYRNWVSGGGESRLLCMRVIVMEPHSFT